MNKNLLLATVLAGSTLLGITGCGDDTPSVTVDPKFAYATGQTYTYESTPRGADQSPTTAEKRDVKWTVLETGLSYQGRLEVAKIKQERMTADGSAVEANGTDTLYITAKDGEFYQYDVMGVVIRRIPAAALIASEIAPAWTKIGDTKNSSALEFTATAESSTTVTVSGIPIAVKYSIGGYHKGKNAVTVPKKAYDNAFTTDLQARLKADVPGFGAVTNDSLKVSYAMEVNDGILLQALESKPITFTLPGSAPQTEVILGFDMKLKAKQ